MDSRKLKKTRGKRKGKKHEEKRKGKNTKESSVTREREARNHWYITYELPSFFMNLARESMDS